jgi:hypothetical protein
MDDLAHDPRSLHLYVRKMLGRDDPRGRPNEGVGDHKGCPYLLLVVDQFEELFTLCRNEAERQAFVNNLLTVADAFSPSQGPVLSKLEGEGWGGGSTLVVITLRADFYAHCAHIDPLREALAHYQEYIGPMSAEELRRAVEGPARQGGWACEPGLVDLLLQDIGAEPGALPLLSHALLETWQRRRGHTLTFGGYSESGRVQGAIAQTAERVLQQLAPAQQVIARSIFLRLTELGERGHAGYPPSSSPRRIGGIDGRRTPTAPLLRFGRGAHPRSAGGGRVPSL